MVRLLCTSLLLSLFTSIAHGWGNTDQTLPPLHQAFNFPLSNDQAWFVKPALLIWKPYQDEIDSGFTMLMPPDLSNVEKQKTQNVDFEWNTGARLTLGRYLPHHEEWDVTLASTFFYSDADQTTKGKGSPSSFSASSISELKLITDGWNPSLLGVSLETKLHWRINYFTWDLAVGRLYSITPKIVVHPFICLRSLLLYQKYRTSNESLAFGDNSSVVLRDTRFNAENNIWGLGPRIGSDFAFSFGHGWSFMGNLSGAIVMGRYNIQESIDGFVLGTGLIPSTPTHFKLRDGAAAMRANLEGSIGLGWEKWVKNRSVRIAPSFIFEVSQWFLINNWSATNLAANPASSPFPDWGMLSRRRMGDLAFLGFNVNLQIDF
jgi:hypothetical protein